MQTMLFVLPWPVTLLIIALLVTILFLFVRKVVHRSIKPEVIRRSHDVSGAVYAILGVLYGIVLGLITVQSQERWTTLRDASEKESAIIISIGQLAQSLSETSAYSIQSAAHAYAINVVKHEWNDDRITSREASNAIHNVMLSIAHMEGTADRNLLVSQTLLQLSSELIETRILRLSLMQEHISDFLWSILIGGGIVLTGFMVWFAPENTLYHTVLLVLVASVLASVLLLIFAYEHPTDGPLNISADAYANAAQIIKP